MPPGGGDGGNGNDLGWTPVQLAAAEAAYEVGLQERSVGLGTEIEEIGGDPDDSTGETVEKTYRVYPAWDEEPVWVAGPYSQAAHGSNNVPAAELSNGATVVHDAVGGYSLPDWDWEPGDPIAGVASLAGSGWVEATAFGWAGVATGKAEFRLLRRLKEGVTAPVDAEGNLIKPEIKRTFLKVTTILPEPSGGPLAPEVVTFTIPAGQDAATTTSGVLFPPVTTAGTHRIEFLPVDLKLRASGKIEPAPENDSYQMSAMAGQGDDLGPRPMGTGRQDYPERAYTAPLQVVGTVPILPNVNWRWDRIVTYRSWFIYKNQQGNGWVVGVRRAIIGPKNDHTSTNFEDATPSATGRIYIYDNSALGIAAGPDTASPIGIYIFEKKQFSYKLETNAGGAWDSAGTLDVGQKIILEKVQRTGAVATDFRGVENSCAVRVLDMTITESEVRSIVGGTLPIVISTNAK